MPTSPAALFSSLVLSCSLSATLPAMAGNNRVADFAEREKNFCSHAKAVPGARSKQLNVWALKQNCQASGSAIIHICPTALRIDPADRDYSIIARAPKWTVFIFNKARKTYCSWPSDRYAGLRKDVLFGSWLQERQWQCFATGKHKETGLNIKRMREMQKKGVELSTAEQDAVILATPDIPASPDCLKVYARSIKVPVLQYVPLEGHIAKSLFGLNTSKAYLSTSRARQENVDSSFFDLPQGFKKVAEDISVTGAEEDPGFAELIPDMKVKNQR